MRKDKTVVIIFHTALGLHAFETPIKRIHSHFLHCSNLLPWSLRKNVFFSKWYWRHLLGRHWPFHFSSRDLLHKDVVCIIKRRIKEMTFYCGRASRQYRQLSTLKKFHEWVLERDHSNYIPSQVNVKLPFYPKQENRSIVSQQTQPATVCFWSESPVDALIKPFNNLRQRDHIYRRMPIFFLLSTVLSVFSQLSDASEVWVCLMKV